MNAFSCIIQSLWFYTFVLTPKRVRTSDTFCLLLDPNLAATEESEVTAQPQEGSEDAAVAQDDHRVRILFERSLIACALYEESWTRVRRTVCLYDRWWCVRVCDLCVTTSCTRCSVHSIPGGAQCGRGAGCLQTGLWDPPDVQTQHPHAVGHLRGEARYERIFILTIFKWVETPHSKTFCRIEPTHQRPLMKLL